MFIETGFNEIEFADLTGHSESFFCLFFYENIDIMAAAVGNMFTHIVEEFPWWSLILVFPIAAGVRKKPAH